jgi:WD40 repeat protein
MLRESPYQGLRPFAEEDKAFFFGRESETRIISANLRTRRLTLLYGPSGVGKSSVLQAGVIHHLHQLNTRLQLDLVALDNDFGKAQRTEDGSYIPDEDGFRDSSKSIVVVTFENWREDPHSLIKDAILAALKASLPSNFTTAKNDELRRLKLHEMLLKITGCRQVMELLIILDQFEQYFVYHSVDEKPGDFASEFSRAVLSRNVRANFLVSIREDWLASLDQFTDHIPDFFANSIRIEHMDRKSGEAAIRSPVVAYNEEIRKHQDEPGFSRQEVEIEDPFVDEALNQLETLDLEHKDSDNLSSSTAPKTRRGRIQASGLQIVLQHLWNKVKNDAPPTLSKHLLPPKAARRIFRWYLDESLEHLGFFEKRTAEKLFPFLVTSSGTKLADTAESLAFRSGCNLHKVEGLITKLTKSRILNEHGPLSPREPRPFYEITSDVIAAPIRNWVLRRRWRRRRVAQLSFVIAALISLPYVGIKLALKLRQDQEQAQAFQKQREREQKLQKWENIRRVSAEGDKQIPYLKSVLRGHEAQLTSAVLTADGQILTASLDGSVMLWNPETADPIRVFGGDEVKPIVGAASPDGNLVVTGTTDGTVSLWSRSGYSIPLGGIQLGGAGGKTVTGVSFSPSGDLIAAANTAGDLLLWNSSTREPVADKDGNGRPTLQISFSPSGKRLGTASDDSTATVWQIGNWSEPKVLVGHRAKVNGLAFSPDERYLATASADATVRLWDLKSGQSRELTGHMASVNSVDFDASGQHILSASDDGTARIWNLDNTVPIELKGHRDKVLSASFSPNGLQVVTASRDNTARIWSARSGKLLVELQGHVSQVTYVSYSKDGKYVLTASDDATARIWFAPESGLFEIDTPVIKTMRPYNDYVGPCPVTVGFDVSVTARKGTGSVIYRFKGSDGRIWPTQELVFDEPSTKYLKWYWRITESTPGAETIEVIEPKGIEDQHATFKVTCTESSIPDKPGTGPSPTSLPISSPPGHKQ